MAPRDMTPLRRISLGLILCSVGACQSRTSPWPSNPADVVGQVVEVRAVSLAEGFHVLPSATGENSRASWGRELRIQVAGARTTLPGYDAYVQVDGITQVAVSGKVRGAKPSDLEGAYVRVWFRGIPNGVGPTRTSALARFVAIDSVGHVGAGARSP